MHEKWQLLVHCVECETLGEIIFDLVEKRYIIWSRNFVRNFSVDIKISSIYLTELQLQLYVFFTKMKEKKIQRQANEYWQKKSLSHISSSFIVFEQSFAFTLIKRKRLINS